MFFSSFFFFFFSWFLFVLNVFRGVNLGPKRVEERKREFEIVGMKEIGKTSLTLFQDYFGTISGTVIREDRKEKIPINILVKDRKLWAVYAWMFSLSLHSLHFLVFILFQREGFRRILFCFSDEREKSRVKFERSVLLLFWSR